MTKVRKLIAIGMSPIRTLWRIIMANFSTSFEIQGTAPVTLPVTVLDAQLLKLDGSTVGSFHFNVENTLPRDLVLNVTIGTAGNAVSKVSIAVDQPVLTIAAQGIATVTATITPSAPLAEGDDVQVTITGEEAIV